MLGRLSFVHCNGRRHVVVIQAFIGTSDVRLVGEDVLGGGAPVDRDRTGQKGQPQLLRDVAWCVVVLEGHHKFIRGVLCYRVVVPPFTKSSRDEVFVAI